MFGISNRTIYRLLRSGKVSCAKIGTRTILRKTDFEGLFTFSAGEEPNKEEPALIQTYSVAEIEDKYCIKYGRLNAIIRKKNIPHQLIQGRLQVSKNHIDRYFRSRRMDTNSIIAWYTVEEAQIQYGLTRDQVYRRISEYKIPKKRDGKFVRISKIHFDQLFTLTI